MKPEVILSRNLWRPLRYSFGTLITSFLVCNINKNKVLSIIGGGQGTRMGFQRDNATIQALYNIKTLLNDKNIRALDFPACSPNVNLIQNL